MTDDGKRFFIDEVVELTSVNFAQKLIDRFKGQRIYVPVKAPHEKHLLTKAFDVEELSVLIDNFGGSYIEIPMHLINTASMRKAKILELRSKSYPVMLIAKETGCTWRWVLKVIKNNKEQIERDKNQGRLFDDI